jgi:hypothetical protein
VKARIVTRDCVLQCSNPLNIDIACVVAWVTLSWLSPIIKVVVDIRTHLTHMKSKTPTDINGAYEKVIAED